MLKPRAFPAENSDSYRMHILASNPDSVAIGPESARTAWSESLRTAIRDPDELCRRLQLSPDIAEQARSAAELFGLFVPLEYLSRIRPGDPHDPLLRQVLPLDAEHDPADGFSKDPLAEADAARSPGLLHKYHGRVLLVVTGTCAIHCRYCFRRHFPYQSLPKSVDAWQPALEQIAADDSIEEVILSGGDPLVLVDSLLAALVERIAAIPHVRRLRVHTRLPIVIPSRVTDELIDWLSGTRLTPLMVIHANHPAELDHAVEQAADRLHRAGVVLLNQAVLLRGVNDDLHSLEELSRRLVDMRVMPYYLHQLDRVAGAAHFEVSRAEGMRLIEQLRGRLPGYAVPRYVQEVAGEPNKVVLL